MILATRAAAPIAALAVLAGLAGCVTLFPKEKPDQLYRFGDNVNAPAAAGPPFAVRYAGIGFDQAAAGDLILTSEGDHVAYVSGGRWAAPASVLFDAAVRRGFGGAGGEVRLLGPAEPGRPPFSLRLEVTRFEARYDHGETSPPTVVISLRATLTKAADPTQAETQPFDVSVPAGDNRIGAIADAFDQATGQVVGKLVDWVDQTGSQGAGEAKAGA